VSRVARVGEGARDLEASRARRPCHDAPREIGVALLVFRHALERAAQRRVIGRSRVFGERRGRHGLADAGIEERRARERRERTVRGR
jgi:hypothetical protein